MKVGNLTCSGEGAGVTARTPGLSHAAAAQLPGAVGHLAGQRGDPGAGALRPPHQLPQGRAPVPAQLVLLQVGATGGTFII